MNLHMTHSKNLSVGFMLATLFILPLQASAIAVPVMVVEDIPFTVKEIPTDIAVKAASSAMLDTVVDNMTNWILTGFNGNPSFVLNPRDLIAETEDNAANVLEQQIANSFICDPFIPKVNFKLAESRTKRGSSNYNLQDEVNDVLDCKLLNIITSGNLENYYAAGGFEREGGYAPLIQAFGRLADDPAGARIVAEELQAARQAKESAEALREVSYGQGFQSLKECVDGDIGTCLRMEVKLPGMNVSNSLQKALTQSMDELSNADEISELIVGLVQALTARAFSNAGLR